MQAIAKYIVIGGVVLVVVGLILYFAGDKLGWLGRLPGDIRIEKENFRFYFPITTMILISVLISLAIWIIRRLF